jgi:hypothetical protein
MELEQIPEAKRSMFSVKTLARHDIANVMTAFDSQFLSLAFSF